MNHDCRLKTFVAVMDGKRITYKDERGKVLVWAGLFCEHEVEKLNRELAAVGVARRWVKFADDFVPSDEIPAE